LYNSWRSDRPNLFEATPSRSRPAALKVLVLVDAGQVATVTVPRSERKQLALLYDPTAGSGRTYYVMSDGDTAVTFEACTMAKHGPYEVIATAFNGGIMVTRRACYELDVVSLGRRYRAVLALGASRCDKQARH